MASNDIISTNVPSKVPTTDTEEYPVQQIEVGGQTFVCTSFFFLCCDT